MICQVHLQRIIQKVVAAFVDFPKFVDGKSSDRGSLLDVQFDIGKANP